VRYRSLYFTCNLGKPASLNVFHELEQKFVRMEQYVDQAKG
jgi:hypothetical protein